MSTFKVTTRITGQPKIIAYADTVIAKTNFNRSRLPIRYRVCLIDVAHERYPYKEMDQSIDFAGYSVPDRHVLIVWADLPFNADLEFDTSVIQELPYPEQVSGDPNAPKGAVKVQVETASTPILNPPTFPAIFKKDDAVIVHHTNGAIATWTVNTPNPPTVRIQEPVRDNTVPVVPISVTTTVFASGQPCNQFVCDPSGLIVLTIDMISATPGSCVTVRNISTVPADMVDIKILGWTLIGADPADNMYRLNMSGEATFMVTDAGIRMIGWNRYD